MMDRLVKEKNFCGRNFRSSFLIIHYSLHSVAKTSQGPIPPSFLISGTKVDKERLQKKPIRGMSFHLTSARISNAPTGGAWTRGPRSPFKGLNAGFLFALWNGRVGREAKGYAFYSLSFYPGIANWFGRNLRRLKLLFLLLAKMARDCRVMSRRSKSQRFHP